jgi:formamidopyrimidine-DNA glycosylase
MPRSRKSLDGEGPVRLSAPMPELPEVETVRRGLQPALEGARLAEVQARRPDLRFPLPPDFVQRLTGARIEALERRAKYLLGRLDRGDTLVMHLGMSGRFEIDGADRSRPGAFRLAAAAEDKHAHVLFRTEAGVRVTYFDPRRFGYMDLVPTEALPDHPWFKGLGPEPLGAVFGAAHLARAFAGRAQNVKATLLDQRVVAGLGNIYVCEALHRAHISPLTSAGRISKTRLEALASAVRQVLEEAIAAGGSTLRDYAGADGQLGYFQHTFRAYGREHEPCPAQGCRGVVKRIVQGGRSTFYCPACQR